MLIRGNAATSAAIHWRDSSDIPVVLIKSQLGRGTVKHNLYLLRAVYDLSTTTCFDLYIGHHQVALLLVIRLTIQYTVWL